jgi:hypothetical protein
MREKRRRKTHYCIPHNRPNPFGVDFSKHTINTPPTMLLARTAAAVAARSLSAGRRSAAAAWQQRTFSSSHRLETAQAGSLLDIGTRPIFDETHDQFRQTTRRFYEEQVVPFHSAWEDQGHVPKELWKQAGDLGLLAVTVPEKYGGYGLNCLYSAIVWEEQVRVVVSLDWQRMQGCRVLLHAACRMSDTSGDARGRVRVTHVYRVSRPSHCPRHGPTGLHGRHWPRFRPPLGDRGAVHL